MSTVHPQFQRRPTEVEDIMEAVQQQPTSLEADRHWVLRRTQLGEQLWESSLAYGLLVHTDITSITPIIFTTPPTPQIPAITKACR